METPLLAHLDSLERALTSLTRSISSYQPSPGTAATLLKSQNTLDACITDLARHQRNHTRIQELRATVTDLDVQLTGHVKSLIDLRQEIRAAPLHAPPDAARMVPARELIDYALVGAKFLPPPSFRPPSAAAATAVQQAGVDVVVSGETQTQQTTAAASPVPGTAVASPEPITPAVTQALATDNVDMANQDNDEKAGIYTLSEQEKSWLDPSLGTPFVPWLNEMQIQASSLTKYQGRPADVLQRMKAEEEAAQREAAALARKKAGLDAEPEDKIMGGSVSQGRAGAGSQPDPAKAVFTGWDDED